MRNAGLRGSQKQETRIAAALGGRRTPGSGNGIRKNDVRTDDLSLEMKYTGKKQYTLKASDLEQGYKHALVDGRDFAFGIELNGKNWILTTEDDFLAAREDFGLRGRVESVARHAAQSGDTYWLHQIRWALGAFNGA